MQQHSVRAHFSKDETIIQYYGLGFTICRNQFKAGMKPSASNLINFRLPFCSEHTFCVICLVLYYFKMPLPGGVKRSKMDEIDDMRFSFKRFGPQVFRWSSPFWTALPFDRTPCSCFCKESPKCSQLLRGSLRLVGGPLWALISRKWNVKLWGNVFRWWSGSNLLWNIIIEGTPWRQAFVLKSLKPTRRTYKAEVVELDKL